MKKEQLPTIQNVPAKTAANVPALDETPYYGTSSCMEVSKQTFEEIEQIVAASASYYKGAIHMQGVWPDRRIIIRSMSIQASQQFDSKPMRQMKYEFMELFREVGVLRQTIKRLTEALEVSLYRFKELIAIYGDQEDYMQNVKSHNIPMIERVLTGGSVLPDDEGI